MEKTADCDIAQEGVQSNAAAAASLREGTQTHDGGRRVCTPAGTAGTGAAATGESEAPKPPAAVSTAHPQLSSPSFGSDIRRNNSGGGRKTSSRQSSGSCKKTSTANASRGRGSNSAVLEGETCSETLLRCAETSKGSSRSSSKSCNSRANSTSSAVNGTITARRCVGCAVGSDSVPVSGGSLLAKVRSSDEVSVASAGGPQADAAFTETVSRACSTAVRGLDDEIVQPTSLEGQQDAQGQRQKPQHENQPEPQDVHVHRRPDIQEKEKNSLQQEAQRQTQGPQQQNQLGPPETHLRHQYPQESESSAPQQSASPSPVPASESDSQHKFLQEKRPALPSRSDVNQSSVVSAQGGLQTLPPVLCRSLKSTEDHLPERQQHQWGQQLQPKERRVQGLQAPQHLPELQHQPQARLPQQQRPQHDPDMQGHLPWLVQPQRETQRLMAPSPCQSSFEAFLTSKLPKDACAGAQRLSAHLVEACENPVASRTQDPGHRISGVETLGRRAGVVPSLIAENVPGQASSSPLRVGQRQQSQMNTRRNDIAPSHPRVQMAEPTLALNAVSSASAARRPRRQLTSLAATSTREQPPRCTRVPSTLPRCSVPASPTIPGAAGVPILNGDIHATTSPPKKAAFFPEAAAVLRGAASAAAAAAAAAADAANLVTSTHTPRASAGVGQSASPALDADHGDVRASARVGFSKSGPHAEPDVPGSRGDQERATECASAPDTSRSTVANTLHPPQESQQQRQLPPVSSGANCEYHCDVPLTTQSCTTSRESLSTSTVVRCHSRAPASCSSANNNGTASAESREAEEPHKLPPEGLGAWSSQSPEAAGPCTAAVAADGKASAAPTLPQAAPARKMARQPPPVPRPAGPQTSIHNDAAPGAPGAIDSSAFSRTTTPAFSENGVVSADEIPSASGGPAPSCPKLVSVAETGSPSEASVAQQIQAGEGPAATVAAAAVPSGTVRKPTAEGEATEEVKQRSPAASECSRQLAKDGDGAQVRAESSHAPLHSQSQTRRFCSPVLLPLQLPDSPCSKSSSRQGTPGAGRPGREPSTAKNLSPTATPETPQNRYQPQQLSMHRTPAPQDRPRRPAAAAAAGGVVVRRGGPVAMWGSGAVLMRPVDPAAQEQHTQGAPAQLTPSPCAAEGGASGIATSSGTAAFSSDAAMASARPCLAEEAGEHGNEQQRPSAARGTSNSFGEKPRAEERGGSGSKDAQEPAETTSALEANVKSDAKETTTTAVINASGGAWAECDVEPPVARRPNATEGAARTLPEVTRQERQPTVLETQIVQITRNAAESKQDFLAPSHVQEQQPQQQQGGQQGQNPTSAVHGTGEQSSPQTSSQPLHSGEAQRQQTRPLDAKPRQEPVIEQRHQLIRELGQGRQVIQSTHAGREGGSTLEAEQLLHKSDRRPISEAVCCDTSALPSSSPCDSDIDDAASRLPCEAAAACSPPSGSSEADDDPEAQVQKASISPGDELVYFNSENERISHRSSSTHKKSKKKTTKHHSGNTQGSGSETSGNAEKVGSNWSDLCKRVSTKDKRSSDCVAPWGGITQNDSDGDLTYFPFSEEQDAAKPFLGEDSVAGESPAPSSAESGRRSDTGIGIAWQTSDLDAAVGEHPPGQHGSQKVQTVKLQSPFSDRGEVQQETVGVLAAADEWRAAGLRRDYCSSSQQLGYASEDEGDLEDSLPVSAAAMAAAAGVAHSGTSRGVFGANDERRPKNVLMHSLPQQARPSSDVTGEDHPDYAPPASAEQANTTWTRSAWDPRYGLYIDTDKTYWRTTRQAGDALLTAQLQHNDEGASVSHLQEHLRRQQQQQPHLWQLQQPQREGPQANSSWTVSSEAAERTETRWQQCDVNYRGRVCSGLERADPPQPATGAEVISTPSPPAAAQTQGGPVFVQGGLSRRASIPAAQIPAGVLEETGEHQMYAPAQPQIFADTGAAFLSAERLPRQLLLPQGRQQDDFHVVQQQQRFCLSGQAAPPLAAAVALHEDTDVALPSARSQPAIQNSHLQQQTPAHQSVALQRGGLFHVEHASGADALLSRSAAGAAAAAAEGASATVRSRGSQVSPVQAGRIPLLPLHEVQLRPQPVQPLQQHGSGVKQVEELSQHLEQPRTPHQQLQQDHRWTQCADALFSSRGLPTENAEVVERASRAGGCDAGVDDKNCGAALVAPPPRQLQSIGDDGFFASAGAVYDVPDYRASRAARNSPVKRAGPGAAAAALAAAASGTAAGINAASSGSPATAAVAGARASPLTHARYQTDDDTFSPFRRTVETRRGAGSAFGNSSIKPGAEGAEGGKVITDFSGEERLHSSLSSKSTVGYVRKRFLGGTTRLFGGVKTHAGIATSSRPGKTARNSGPAALGVSAPYQGLPLNGSGRYEHGIPTHSPRSEASPRHYLAAAVQPQEALAGLHHQQPHPLLRNMEQQQQLFPSLHPGSLSQQQTPRACHQPQPPCTGEQMQAMSPFLVQQFPQPWPNEPEQYRRFYGKQGHEANPSNCSLSLSLGLLQQERRPSLHTQLSARSRVSRREKSCGSTFLCETIPGSNSYLTIAPVGRGSQRGSSLSTKRAPPPLPCVAGRLLVAGGRVVGDVGQAAVDVGSTMVKEFASMLQRGLDNILEKGGDGPCMQHVAYDCMEYQRMCSKSFCVPQTCMKAARGDFRGGQLPHPCGATRSADPALNAGQARRVVSRETDAQLQRDLWLQAAFPGELQQQQQQRVAPEESQRPLDPDGLHSLEHVQQSEETPQVMAQLLEEHKHGAVLDQAVKKEDTALKAWGIATEERLGGLWIPKVECQQADACEAPDRQFAAGTYPQQHVSQHLLENEPPQQQRPQQRPDVDGKANNQQYEGIEGKQQTACLQGNAQEQILRPSQAEYAETQNSEPRCKADGRAVTKHASGVIQSHQWLVEGQRAAYRKRSTDYSQENDQSEREQSPHKHEALHRPAMTEGIPAFPLSLRWTESAPQISSNQSYGFKEYRHTGVRNSQKFQEQQEIRDRLVRRANLGATSRPSDKDGRPRVRQALLSVEEQRRHAFSPWNGDKERAPVQQRMSAQPFDCISTAYASNIAFPEQQDGRPNDDPPGAAPPCLTSATGSCLRDRRRANLVQSDAGLGLTESGEPRKGTSTFGTPEVMQQFDGERDLRMCYSDDSSNCSTVHSGRDNDHGRREPSTETLSPHASHPRKALRKNVRDPADSGDEKNRVTLLLHYGNQQNHLHEGNAGTHGSRVLPCQDAEGSQQHEHEMHYAGRLAPLQVHVLPQQQSCLSLQVQGIPPAKEPFMRHARPISPSPGLCERSNQGSSFSMPYGAAMSESESMSAKLEACDRIVQRWKERATKVAAASLAAGARRAR